MSFLRPIEMADAEVRPGLEHAVEGARANGTPFVSFFGPAEMLALAREAGFRKIQLLSSTAVAERYFAGRKDGLRPPNNSEELLVAGIQAGGRAPFLVTAVKAFSYRCRQPS